MPKPFPISRQAMLETVAAESDGRCLLAFSRGKDALAAWLELKQSGLFREIVPFHLDLVPGMRFVDESLAYFEKAMKTRILRLAHPSFYRMIGHYVFQTPDRLRAIHRLGFRNVRVSYNDIRRWLADDLGWPEDRTWLAVGVRAADSPQRRLNILRTGPFRRSDKTFYPVFDYRIADVRAAIEESGIKLPVDYEWFGRSFDGVDARFIGPLKEHAPEDYKRVLFWFPFADMELERLDFRKRDYDGERLEAAGILGTKESGQRGASGEAVEDA